MLCKLDQPVVITNQRKPRKYNYCLFVRDVTEFFIAGTPPVWRVRLADGKLWDTYKDNCKVIK